LHEEKIIFQAHFVDPESAINITPAILSYLYTSKSNNNVFKRTVSYQLKMFNSQSGNIEPLLARKL